MKQNKITRQEIQDWINFLYSDLLNDNIYIGGYYFNFKQLEDFKKQEYEVEKIIKKREKDIQLSNFISNASYSDIQRAQNENLKQQDNISVNLTTKNKFNEIITFPCTKQEFDFVHRDLKKAKDDVEHFKNFLTEELQNVKDTDLDGYMIFINDFLKDIREKFAGKSSKI